MCNKCLSINKDYRCIKFLQYWVFWYWINTPHMFSFSHWQDICASIHFACNKWKLSSTDSSSCASDSSSLEFVRYINSVIIINNNNNNCWQVVRNSLYELFITTSQLLSETPRNTLSEFSLVNLHNGSDIQGRSLAITQPLGSSGCLWKLRMFIGMYHHSHYAYISDLVTYITNIRN